MGDGSEGWIYKSGGEFCTYGIFAYDSVSHIVFHKEVSVHQGIPQHCNKSTKTKGNKQMNVNAYSILLAEISVM